MAITTRSKDIAFKYNLKLDFSFLKKYKFALITVLIMILLMESRNVIEKYFFKLVIDKGTEFNAGNIPLENLTHALIIIFIIFISMGLLNIMIVRLRIHFLNRLESNMIVDMKRKFFKHILELDHNFHTTHKTGSLI